MAGNSSIPIKMVDLYKLIVPIATVGARRGTMVKTISSSDLRSRIRRVLNEVGYGDAQYVAEEFGGPAVAIISVDDFRLLQQVKAEQAAASLRQRLDELRARTEQVNVAELDTLIDEARAARGGGRGDAPPDRAPEHLRRRARSAAPCQDAGRHGGTGAAVGLSALLDLRAQRLVRARARR
jgi:prevent-host-death family protein